MCSKGSRDSLSVEVSQEGNDDTAHTNHSQLVPGANQASEENGSRGSTEHIPVNLFPAIFITQVTLLQNKGWLSLSFITHWHIHMWQSRVEIEGYSVAYFDRIAAFKAPYRWTSIKGGAHMRFVDSLDIHASTKHVWAPPLTEVQRYGALNAAMRSKYATE